MNGLSLLALLGAVIAALVAYRVGVRHGSRIALAREPFRMTSGDLAREKTSADARASQASTDGGAVASAESAPARNARDEASPAGPLPGTCDVAMPVATTGMEMARLVRSYAAEADRLRAMLRSAHAGDHARVLADAERARLHRELADAHGETARYRQIVVDIENNTPPPLLDGPGTPDDLKLIVGVGPVLERMLQQLGITTYRQIAWWTDRDIDEIDARLAEFPGRIRRDGWVTQARELHQSKYGQPPART